MAPPTGKKRVLRPVEEPFAWPKTDEQLEEQRDKRDRRIVTPSPTIATPSSEPWERPFIEKQQRKNAAAAAIAHRHAMAEPPYQAAPSIFAGEDAPFMGTMASDPMASRIASAPPPPPPQPAQEGRPSWEQYWSGERRDGIPLVTTHGPKPEPIPGAGFVSMSGMTDEEGRPWSPGPSAEERGLAALTERRQSALGHARWLEDQERRARPGLPGEQTGGRTLADMLLYGETRKRMGMPDQEQVMRTIQDTHSQAQEAYQARELAHQAEESSFMDKITAPSQAEKHDALQTYRQDQLTQGQQRASSLDAYRQDQLAQQQANQNATRRQYDEARETKRRDAVMLAQAVAQIADGNVLDPNIKAALAGKIPEAMSILAQEMQEHPVDDASMRRFDEAVAAVQALQSGMGRMGFAAQETTLRKQEAEAASAGLAERRTKAMEAGVGLRNRTAETTEKDRDARLLLAMQKYLGTLEAMQEEVRIGFPLRDNRTPEDHEAVEAYWRRKFGIDQSAQPQPQPPQAAPSPMDDDLSDDELLEAEASAEEEGE